MKRNKSHFEDKEAVLEKFLQELRFRKVMPLIKRNSRHLDLGCGYNGGILIKVGNLIKEGVGLDVALNKNFPFKNTKLIKGDLNQKLPFKEKEFDTITALAVLEHVEKPEKLLSESFKILKNKGLILITTPDKKAQTLLFLMAKLGLVSKLEISDHKQYFDKKMLKIYLHNAGFKKVKVETFEYGFNLFARGTKP